MTLDLDLISDAEHPGHAGHGVFGGNALTVMAHRASQEDTALTSGRLEAVRDRAIRRERLVRKLDCWAAAWLPCRASWSSFSSSLDRDVFRTVPPYLLIASTALSGVTFSRITNQR